MKGKLYGIGVGPGDPELLTLKAKRLIEECDIVAVPVKKEGEDSVALNIAKGAVKISEEKIQEIVFTMAKDKTKREACRQAAAEEIMKLLDEGKSIAMLALCDIGIYSQGIAISSGRTNKLEVNQVAVISVMGCSATKG